MSDVGRKAHWENVYTTKSEKEVSWFQENPEPSLELIALAGLSADAAIIDIGGGASRLVDALVNGWLRMSPPGSHPKPTISGTTVRRFIFSPMLPIAPPISAT
jgi:hypothetical protein